MTHENTPTEPSTQTYILASAKAKSENPFLGIIFNILLPIAILNQGAKRLGPEQGLTVLLIALAVPIGYGLYDYWAHSRKNYISLFGVINVAFTGGLALLHLEGFWFAIKEAAFPLLLGIAVIISGLIKKPFIKTMLWNPQILNISNIEDSLRSYNTQSELEKLFSRVNHIFAASFFISSALNFILALRIFKEIDPALTADAKQLVLNEQIAQMTWQGYVVIALPLMVLMIGLLFYVVRKLQAMTQLPIEALFNDPAKK